MIGCKNTIRARRAHVSVAAATLAGLMGLGSLGLMAAADKQGGTPVSGEALVAPSSDLPQDVNDVFNLLASKTITLDLNTTPDLPVDTQITIDGEEYHMALTPHSIRAAGFKLVAQIDDGSYLELDPGPDRTLRGSLLEVPGSSISAMMMDEGLFASIRMPDGHTVYIEPMFGRVAGAAANEYVQYTSEDIIHPEGVCGVDDDFIRAFPAPVIPMEGGNGGQDGLGVHCTEIAIDADVEYYQSYGSNVTNVQNRVTLVINTVNNQYITECDIQFVITQIIVRTAEPDPYSSTVAGTLLNQFASHWNASQQSVPRDVAHLFTAKNLADPTVGIAFLGTICNTSMAYSLVQSDCCGGGNFACVSHLSSHELGHNWNAPHCSCPSNTMNPSVNCSNIHAATSINSIIAYRDSINCLSSCADATLPFVETFPSTTFDPNKWTTIVGAIIDGVGMNEPSAPNSMRLRGSSTGGQEARTSRIDTTNLAVLTLSYFHQRGGGGDPPESGDNLVIEYFNNQGLWTAISTQLGGGAPMTTFTQATVNFPQDAMHEEFRLRFRNTSSQNFLDDWFVDNINLDGVAFPSNDDCIDAPLKGVGSHAFSTIGATTDGPNEPGSCNFNGDSNIGNDVWIKFLAQCTGTATASTCGATFNTKLAVYGNCPTASGQALTCNDDFCGTSSQISFPVVSGQLYRIRIGGFNNATGQGTLVISCTPGGDTCPADINNDNSVNVGDLLAVINAWGPCAGCPADVNNDGQVNVGDLLAVINAWGACPP